MSRQLNPGLFGDLPQQGLPGSSPGNLDTSLFNEPSIVMDKFIELKEDLEKVKFDSQDFSKSSTLKVDKIVQKLQLFEERLNMIQRESQAKWAELSSRVREKALSEAKIESIMERHNQIIQSFELRLTQAQKVIENQTLNLAKQQEIIDESRRQIEKLKKL